MLVYVLAFATVIIMLKGHSLMGVSQGVEDVLDIMGPDIEC